MRKRCNYKKDKFYYRYGGRGITVCPEWDIFEIFYAEMGPRPSDKHSLDRIDNNGNYEQQNCRWTTLDVQVISRKKGVGLQTFARKNSLGVRGVDQLPSGKFRAKFKRVHLGVFENIKEASQVYKKAQKVYVQEFKNKKDL